MQETIEEVTIDSVEVEKGFNYNKLQAVICIALSAVVSVGLILWAVKTFL
ncbi:MAG: hypothetical protein HYS18_16850 [Burkholderiales bacterium]|nr:hypothetical protein [Burkholderiales bacterium]